jgi:serralysin
MADSEVTPIPYELPPCSLCAGLAIKPNPPKDEDQPDIDIRGAASQIDKEWPAKKTLDVYFTNGTEGEKNVVKRYAPTWSEYCGIKFRFNDTIPATGAQVRVYFGPVAEDPSMNEVFYSYLGKDGVANFKNPSIDNHTMRLDFGRMLRTQKANPATSTKAKSIERQLKALVLHEFGHALALVHEHLRPKMGDAFTSEEDVLNYYREVVGFTDEETRSNVLERYAEEQLHQSKDDLGVDFSSIMMYAQPASIMKSGKEIKYVFDLSQHDKDFIGQLYPK